MPYLYGLCKEHKIHLLTFEKKQLIKKKPEEFKQIKDKLSREGILWHRLSYHKLPPILSSFYDIFVGTIFSLFLVIRFKISIIHARSNIPIAIGFILKRILFVKLLYDRRGIMAEDHTEHSGWKQEGWLYRVAVWFERQVLVSSDAIVVLTDAMNKHLKNTINFQKDTLIKTIPCCTDLVKFKVDNNRSIGEKNKHGLTEKFVFVYSGSVGTYNLLNEMLDFFQVTTSLIPNVHFLILTQNKDVAINILRDREQIDKTRITVRYVSPDEVPSFLSIADAALIFRKDSPTAMAASPTKFGEYLACGLPVITMSRIGDLGQIVNFYKIGVVLNSYNISEYKKAVEKLLLLLKEKNDLKKRCRRIAENSFSLNRGINEYLNIYKDLMRNLK